MLLELQKKPVLAWEREARFNFKKLQANVETRRGNKETLQSMCKAPLPPTSPPTQATAFANIAQHWQDTYKKSDTKTQKNILDLSHSYPAIPAAPLPKAPKKLPKSYQKATKKHPKSITKPSRTPPQKSNQKNSLILVFLLPRVSKMDPKGTLKSQKPTNFFIFSP